MEEKVNHPSHYTHNGKECIVLMEEKWGKIAVVAFCLLNAFKYEYRAGYKKGNPVKQDEEKALWYRNHIDKTISKMNFLERVICKKFLFNK